MGKRKYNDDSEESVKRSKKPSASEDDNEQNEDAQPQSEINAENENKKTKKHLNFDIKHFRKELAEKQGQTMALTQFLQVCLNPDSDIDYLAEYLRVGGNSHEILRQISTDNKKNLSLATPTFHIFHLIILKVQSSMPQMIMITEEACRYFLNTFIPTVEIMISENSGPRHRKIILNLLTSMVTMSSDLGVEVLNQLPLTPKHLQYIVEKPNYKEKDNVRTAFVHFMTSFLVDGHLPLIKALLEKQGLLPLVIPGLIQDEAEAVVMFLNILEKNVINNTLISKTLKLKTFSHQVLHNLFKVFNWKGPPELNNDVRNESRPEILTLLSNIIKTLFTSHKLGLYFVDPYLGTGETNKNQNLYKALLSLKRPWENNYECDTVLEIVFKCPDLHRAVIHVIEQSFQPQHSPIWEKATEFTIALINKLHPEDMVPRLQNLNSMQTVNFIRFVTLPVPLLKLMQASIGTDQQISLYSIKVLVKMLQSLKRYMALLELEDSNIKLMELRSKLEYFIPKHVPAPNVIVSLINDITSGNEKDEVSQDYKLPKLNTADSLLSLIDLLLLYNYVHPAFFESLESSIDMKTILEFTKTLSSGQISLLKFKVVSLWLILDETAISLKNPMFKDLFLIMLEVFTSDEEDTWIEAKETLHNFFKNTEIFETDENEIHLMLYSLRNAQANPISIVADVVEYVLKNKNDLTDYIKNQMVNFEISDESNEANLEKLFNDLMNNKNTEDSMFLENKLPSPFIIGSIQYIQGNKEAKKSLKGFLSLFIANLLHCNYSPELSEVLIGDSKLDVRSYVADWTTKPVSLPDTLVKDEILLKISNSIINDEDITITDIFPILISSEDDYDFALDNLFYKIPLQKSDSTQLFIWAKYLMFCAVGLSKTDELTPEKQKKIITYFQVIIAIGKKHHFISTIRNILLNLFKNTHFLKIFKALDVSKKSYILVTDFLLQIITQNREIIDYLDRKHFILRSFQHKTYTEIVKAFIKINKRKNVNSDHTIKVLDIVGLSKENDNQVFDLIFNTELESCIKDDKEPSVVIEILRVLIEKYSKSIDLELSAEIVTKSMKLYTDLITNKDFTINLTGLENALTDYFENKPHQVLHVTEEEFKKFFHANTIRKSTSNLASVLLKFNNKFCIVYKDEIKRPEILSQRELTLPLGNAIVNHGQFLANNKEILEKLYDEYKSNISKYLEKPHKAGQVYIASWKLLKKLVTECMTIPDCKKIFSKIHKFEVLDLSHVKLLQVILYKIYLNAEENKIEYFINYISAVLNVVLNCLKDEKINDLDETISYVYSTTQISKIKQLVDNKDEFKKVIDGATWKNFCKAVLKSALKVKTADQDNSLGPKLLCLLTVLVKYFYPVDHEDVAVLFDMVTSHSEFLNVMLSYHSLEIKSRLLQFLYSLITLNKSIMKSQQIPVYLSAYHATKNPCDRLILSILQYYESNGLPVNEYKPYLWGDSAANYYAVRKKRTASLWSHPTPNQVLNLFDRETIAKTVRNFPVEQRLDYYFELPETCESLKDVTIKMYLENEHEQKAKLAKCEAVQDNESVIKGLLKKDEYSTIVNKYKESDVLSVSHFDEDDEIYDPAFLFPLLSHLLAPGSMASCFKLLRTGLLSVTVVALGSHCPMMRAAAYHVLHRFCMLLELETRHKNDKLLLTDFVTTLRQSLTKAMKDAAKEDSIFGDLKNPKLPAIGVLYLAKALTVCTAPSEPLYKPVNNFLIAKQFVDLSIVPDFLSLFHDNEVESLERRLWILDVMTNGIKTMIDVVVVFKSMCLKMLMDFYTTVLCDKRTKVKIIKVLNSIVAIPKAFEILLEGHGLMAWLHSIVWYIAKDDKVVVEEILVLIKTIIESMNINTFHKQMRLKVSDVKVKSDVEYEILSFIYELLNHVDCYDVDDVISYVNLYNLISKRTIKFLTKKQVTNVVHKCSEKIKGSESVKIISQALVLKNPSMLRSKIVKNDGNRLVRELDMLVDAYIS
ncbi:unnamed protein product [Colias eurytheme]|nr:unnamed protein product [Colias eurytheme]